MVRAELLGYFAERQIQSQHMPRKEKNPFYRFVGTTSNGKLFISALPSQIPLLGAFPRGEEDQLRKGTFKV